MRTLVSQSLSSLTAPGPSRNSPKLGKFLMDILVSDFLQYFNSFAENQENKVLSNFILVITTYFTTDQPDRSRNSEQTTRMYKTAAAKQCVNPRSKSWRFNKKWDISFNIDRKSLAFIKNSCGFRENLFYLNINTISLDNNNILQIHKTVEYCCDDL